jgi:hypothetical protein
MKRYVIFRVYAKNLFGDKKEFVNGEILGEFDKIRDIAKSPYFLDKEKTIDLYKKALAKFDEDTNKNDNQILDEEIRHNVEFLKERLNLLGSVTNVDTSKLEQSEINKLLQGNYHGGAKPINFILLDNEGKSKIETKEAKKWLDLIKKK